MIDIVSVGNQKLKYQDSSEINFESLDFYITLAQKTISKFGRKFSPVLSREMLKSEDAISGVANAIMMADWRWDNNRIGEKTGQQKTKYSYRNQCAIWAIQSYMSRKTKKKKAKTIDIITSSNDKDLSILDLISDKTKQPIDQIIESESIDNLKNYLYQVLSTESGIISDRQASYIKMYYFEDMTFADIGKKFNVTREAVRQGIKKAIEKIQQLSK